MSLCWNFRKMMMNRKNLLELCLSPDLGGLELYMMRAAKALCNNFNVISIISPKGKLSSYYKGTKHQYLFLKKNSNLFMLSAAYRLAKIIDEHKIDIVHLHWTKDIPIAVLAKKLSKQNPKLVQTRNMNMTRFKDDFYHRFLYKNMNLLLPVTQRVADQINKFIPANIRPEVEVLYMGTDVLEVLDDEALRRFKDREGMTDTFAVGMVGRMEEHKGQHLLIEAIAGVEDVDAFFVGHEMKAGYIEHLKTLAQELGVEKRIHFLGFMDQPAHFMQACDAMVLATPCETFGLVVIEAMAVGTPMIATSACGPLEIIDDQMTGLLFDINSTQDLSRKIELLRSDAAFGKKLSINARSKVEVSFDNTKQFEKLARILGRL